ncbi:preprotein translocase subunit SecE [Alkalilimnicola ehrlichii]|uniref:Protein translocase subunit SecE n=1 Tax=Alkalilimnicola ehrlichii TaxID=351052 RepID=A0A3E0WGN3_9GAMM|nr:preprotein translocase subunit SecE [Alkalilimnicola ehrlichii]RFA24455.1 preprotein translocase subunit SecE [Alkalilimnicola ehrlichii]RFA31609.1 preprotein translocase subunit SecE [Alkalilimnicola ehrlichii]
MNSKPVAQKSPLDTPKLLLALAIVVAGTVGFYYYADELLLFRVLGLLAFVAVAVAIVMTTELGRSIWGFFRESRNELRRVVWPTKQETTQTTLIVLVMVMLVAVFLWLLDILLRWGVGALMRLGGG